jgi:hypothetical protein
MANTIVSCAPSPTEAEYQSAEQFVRFVGTEHFPVIEEVRERLAHNPLDRAWLRDAIVSEEASFKLKMAMVYGAAAGVGGGVLTAKGEAGTVPPVAASVAKSARAVRLLAPSLHILGDLVAVSAVSAGAFAGVKRADSLLQDTAKVAEFDADCER